MLALQPASPWRATYETTANAIAETVAREEPLFAGDLGRERTAALLVALAWHESTFRPDAVGDHGRSRGLFQVQGRGALSDPQDAVKAALGMLRASFDACRARPLKERAAWYASGSCDRGLRESRHRMQLAEWIFRKFPPPGASS